MSTDTIIREFQQFINDTSYPCVAARAALSRQHIPCLVTDHMACPKDDSDILRFLYEFVTQFRLSQCQLHSAAIIFKNPEKITEEMFERFLWQRLQSLSDSDAIHFDYDVRVSRDPSAPDFSFSLGGEAFFVIGLHPGSGRRSRRFKYPAIVFNPHAQFEEMRKTDKYQKLQRIIRKRDILYSGSINPMLSDFGEASEAFQYSGKVYQQDWTCPLKVTHANTNGNSAKK